MRIKMTAWTKKTNDAESTSKIKDILEDIFNRWKLDYTPLVKVDPQDPDHLARVLVFAKKIINIVEIRPNNLEFKRILDTDCVDDVVDDSVAKEETLTENIAIMQGTVLDSLNYLEEQGEIDDVITNMYMGELSILFIRREDLSFNEIHTVLKALVAVDNL
jgi:hypothetical protein